MLATGPIGAERKALNHDQTVPVRNKHILSLAEQ
jgi:hypothetical protein